MMNAFDICVRFLDRKPESRLGSNGFDEIKNHPWFAGIDWDKLYRKELPVPYVGFFILSIIYSYLKSRIN